MKGPTESKGNQHGNSPRKIFARSYNAETGKVGFLEKLQKIVGRRRLLTSQRATARYRAGFRFGTGDALAVVRPTTLVQLWRVLQLCAKEDKVIIMQAANTGLTGGSTPSGNDYRRGAIIINTMSIDGIHIINDGCQVVCLPGTTLNALEAALEPLGREPHSVIGSSCIGASVIGGICNNSGGALVQRGPAYTELALFARIDSSGELSLVNHLGIELPGDPEEILERVEKGEFEKRIVRHDPSHRAFASGYVQRVRDVNADRPTRFNADPSYLFEASGSAGKIAVLAVRLDTFPKDDETGTFYIGTNNPATLEDIRRCMLSTFEHLPVSGEYIHRTAFDIAARYGKDTFMAIRLIGTRRLPVLYRLKDWIDRLAQQFGRRTDSLSDAVLQRLSTFLPEHLPARIRAFRDAYEHHLIVKMSGGGINEARALFSSFFPSSDGDFFECTADEASKAFLHRFTVAGAAVRYRLAHRREVADIVSLDIALRANDRDWFEQLPDAISEQITHALYYGHYFCHVFHHDYIVRRGYDPTAIEHALCELLDERGAEYPAEHNVGHLYHAKPALAEFYRRLDPRNIFNPGIGQTSKKPWWK